MTPPVPEKPAATPPTLRRRLGRVRRRLIGVRDLETRTVKHGERLTRLTDRVAKLSSRLQAQHEATTRLDRRLADIERAAKVRATEHDKLGFQFGAIEQRLGALEQRVSDGDLVVDAPAEAEARRLLDEVRAEHARVRARLQVVSAYEERLRRVEESVAQVHDGDPRHLV